MGIKRQIVDMRRAGMSKAEIKKLLLRDTKIYIDSYLQEKILASAKQIAWRKKFAKMAKAGKFRKKKALPKTIPKNQIEMVKTENEFYREYKKLGGKKSRAKYKSLLNEFYDHTLDIFTGTGGEQIRYSTRNEALYGFKKSAKIDWKEVDRIYDSVNNIHAYT